MGAAKTFWFFGLSGAGKSTLADAFHRMLVERGRASTRLDGDLLRQRLNADLGFSPGDRRENIRRAAEVARILNEAGVTVIASFISPLRADRALARDIIGPDRWVGVFVDAPLHVCEARDPKGHYRKARRGELTQFTGVSAAFETDTETDGAVRVDSASASPDATLAYLEHGLLHRV